MLENWQKLVSKQKYFLFLRENLNLVQLKSCYQTEREISISKVYIDFIILAIKFFHLDDVSISLVPMVLFTFLG